MKPTYIEWAKAFLACDHEPMTEEMSRVFIQSMMIPEVWEFPPELVDEFAYKVLTKRAAFIGLKLTPGATMLLLCLSKNPGDAVMFVYAFYYLQQVKSMDIVDVAAITEAFPMGFPTAKALLTAWNLQEVGGVNLLDTDVKEVANA